MSTKFYTLLTDIGAAKLANATALGVPLKINQMAVGDGGGILPTPSAQQTKLVGEKRRAALNQLYIDPQNASQIIAEQVIPENEGGWWIREVGLFDESGALIAVGNCAESYKPLLAEGSGRTQTVRMILITRSTDNITLKIDPSIVLATRKYVDDKVIELTAYIDDKLAKHVAAADPHTQYAPKASPELTGVPKAPTAGTGANSKQIATTEFVQAAIAALVASSPAALDTLNELAAALGNDPNFATTMTKALAGKQPLDQTLSTLSGKSVSELIKYLGVGSAGKLDTGNGDNQIPDMSYFDFNRDGQKGWDLSPNGAIRQFGTITLTPVGNFNPQTLGGVTYYTHYYRVSFPRAYPNKQVATVATLASNAWANQTSMAGRSLAIHRDSDDGSTVSKTKFVVAYTTTVLGETPTLHYESAGY